MTQLLVYESKPLNAALFHRLADSELREVRSLMQLKQAIDQRAPQIVAIEITEQKDLLTVVRLIQTLKRNWPAISVICMPLPAVSFGTLWLYEAGTDLIFRSMLDRDRLSAILRRACRRHGANETEPNSVRQRVYSAIPWKRHAS